MVWLYGNRSGDLKNPDLNLSWLEFGKDQRIAQVTSYMITTVIV